MKQELNTEAAETDQIGSSPAVAQERLVRRWWDTDYPIIARLNHNTFDLVAHPNGPALCDGDMMASIDTHPDDSRELMKLKMQAQAAWREYAWPLVKGNFYPTNSVIE